MQHDPLYQYILLQIPRRRHPEMTPPFMPLEFTEDPSNRHSDNRVTWLAWRDPEPTRPPVRQRLGRLLVRFGQWVAGHRSELPPQSATAGSDPAHRPLASLETAP